MNEHDDACVDAMLMVNMQANTRSVTLLILEINLHHSNDIFYVELSMSHVDLVDRSVPLGVPKDVLMQK